MTPAIINLPTAYRGDIYEPISFVLTEFVNDVEAPLDISNASYAMEFKRAQTKELVLRVDTFTLIGTNQIRTGELIFPKFGILEYDLQITFPTARPITYFRGKIEVLNDVTDSNN